MLANLQNARCTGNMKAMRQFASTIASWFGKLVRQGVKGTWELFDLKTDRTEQYDLAAEHADEVAALAKQWNVWAKDSNVLPKPAAKGKKRKARSGTGRIGNRESGIGNRERVP